uniref:Uncharacterized protein n=1 Tax=Rhipicephalus zambeziensis TaxID=60191 RepID=A0A224YIF5_9ACAR
MPDIYGIAMAPLISTTVVHPELIKAATSWRKCDQCSCRLAWELTKYHDHTCEKEFEFTCTCNAYTCEKKHIQICMAKTAMYL